MGCPCFCQPAGLLLICISLPGPYESSPLPSWVKETLKGGVRGWQCFKAGFPHHNSALLVRIGQLWRRASRQCADESHSTLRWLLTLEGWPVGS